MSAANPARQKTCWSLLSLALWALASCAGHREPPGEPPAHSIGAVTPSVEAPERGFLGVILAPESAELTAQLDGRVQSVKARPGDRVLRGQLLVSLDIYATKKELAMAHARYLAAKANIDKARLEIAHAQERLTRRSATVELHGGATATSSGEERETARYEAELSHVKRATARAELLERQAQYEQLLALSAEGTVRAPFDGTVAARYVDSGSSVRKGAPLVRVLASSEPRVRFVVPEERVAAIGPGTPVKLRAHEREVSAVVDAVAPEVDAAARMVFVEGALRPSGHDSEPWRSGQAVRVFLPPVLAGATP